MTTVLFVIVVVLLMYINNYYFLSAGVVASFCWPPLRRYARKNCCNVNNQFLNCSDDEEMWNSPPPPLGISSLNLSFSDAQSPNHHAAPRRNSMRWCGRDYIGEKDLVYSVVLAFFVFVALVQLHRNKLERHLLSSAW